MPKLQKNRRLESMWGVKYYTAVKNAVFIQTQPYVPIVPPPSLKEQVLEHETLYMCPQCKDCFYFRSSLDDHISRKSWILGYWCQHCFVTTCKHKSTEDTLCSTCTQLDHEKRLYLRSRGLRSNKKLGAIRIFYNQCQFFSHLKAHNVNLVNMGDLMLMPLPTNTFDWSPEIDIICEALMEHTFIIKIHIMDWLKDKAISNNWWQLTKDTNNPVALILKGYKGRLHFKPLEIPIDEEISILNHAHPLSNSDKIYSDTVILDSVENMDKKASSSSTDVISISDERVIENEDNPCKVNDITFVDCGLSKFFEPEFPLNNKEGKGNIKSEQDASTTQEHSKVINKSKQNKIRHLNSVLPNMIMSYGNTVITPKHDIKDLSKHSTNKRLWKSLIYKSNKSNNNVSIKTVTESNKQVEFDKKENKTLFNNLIKAESLSKNIHTLTVTSGQKVVTFQSTKRIDINAIINQLPSHMINNKKIVFVGQTSDDTSVRKNKESSSEGVIHLVPVDNAKLSGTKISEESEELLQIDKEYDENISKNQTEPIKTFSSKVIYQNGQKYIVKQSSDLNKNLKSTLNAVVPVKDVQESKSTNVPPLVFYNIPRLIPLDSTEIENASNQEKINSFHNDVSPLTPSPSPSELSNSSSCDIQSKPSLSVKSSQKVDVPHTECKDIGIQNTKKTFESLSFHKGEDQNLYLDKRHDHLQEIAEEISRVMSFVTDNVIKENLKAVHILQTVLKHCIDKCIEKSDDTEEKDVSLNEWEVEYEQVDKRPICKACNKIMKPKHYIPGFSKLARNDIYCSCYRHVCHKCNTYQGNSTRFVAHQTFHDKKKPYLCPDCYRKFSTYKSLEVHTWTACFHTLKRRVLGCKICEIDGFQDMESIARHFAIMHSHNKIVCDKCYLLLPSYSEYRKHHKNKHSDASSHHPIRLVLCKLGRCIVRYEDYMLHMEKHIVVQRLIWFKCPFCTFIHVEAKRIMSHLQSGHESRLKELISSEALWNVFQVETAANLLKNNLQRNKFTNAHAGSCKDGTVMPKIINARTITSEIFERGAQGADDHLINYDTPHCSKIVNVNSESSVPKILDVRSIAEYKKTETTSKFVSTGSKGIKGNKTCNDQQIKTEFEDIMDCTWTTEAIKPISDPLNIESLQQDHFLRMKNGQDVHDTLQNKICEKKEVQLVEQTNQANTREQLEDIKHESISKPPPLARIPQHVLEANRPKKIGQTTKKKKTLIFSHDQNINLDFQRVALVSSDNSNEILNFTCPLCRELINTSKSVINSHFQSKHSQDCKPSTITVSLLRVSPEFINGGYKELLDKKKRKSESTMSSSKKRRRWNPKKYNNDGKNGNFTGVGLCVTQETAEDSEGNFRCKKCDQRCSNMSTLRDHIASNHRIKGRYLVCLECGDNFVVAPSLQMHLKAFHGIENPITYMMQNTSYAPDNVDNLEVEGKSIEANQCHVCMAVFEDKAAVDKHLRVHGMAFLNRKRIEAQNALKSPEKKSEMQEEKSTSVKACPKENIRKDKPAETILEKIS
ncbi:unnamed protein product, partial [Heterotrigona itama]